MVCGVTNRNPHGEYVVELDVGAGVAVEDIVGVGGGIVLMGVVAGVLVVVVVVVVARLICTRHSTAAASSQCR